MGTADIGYGEIPPQEVKRQNFTRNTWLKYQKGMQAGRTYINVGTLVENLKTSISDTHSYCKLKQNKMWLHKQC
jgi:hypothetical protein